MFNTSGTSIAINNKTDDDRADHAPSPPTKIHLNSWDVVLIRVRRLVEENFSSKSIENHSVSPRRWAQVVFNMF